MIEVLKQALEALELALRSHGVMLLSDPPQDAWKTYGVDGNARQAITSLRQAIAELESQEPVAWGVFEGNLHDMFFSQEEAQEMAELKGTHAEVRPLYATPQRTWVGLTNNELQPIADEYRILFGSWVEDFARAIEAKLKDKNNAA
jgi:hypothetical protein